MMNIVKPDEFWNDIYKVFHLQILSREQERRKKVSFNMSTNESNIEIAFTSSFYLCFDSRVFNISILACKEVIEWSSLIEDSR